MTIEEPLRVAVIVGSTHIERRGGVVGDWVRRRVMAHPNVDVDHIDLVETMLPAVLGGDDGDAAAYRKRIDAADAFVVVTPEYNHGYPASLKQAIDLAYEEWRAKPVGFVSYGGLSGGLRAVEQLRPVFAELHAVTIRDSVAFPGNRFGADGEPLDTDAVELAAATMLEQLTWWGLFLRDARERSPYLVG